jgi:hypothetical protein
MLKEVYSWADDADIAEGCCMAMDDCNAFVDLDQLEAQGLRSPLYRSRRCSLFYPH